MRAKGYVAITLGVVGLLLSLTLYGLAISWIFLIPSVILSRTESRRVFSETGKTAGALVVCQVLSWISLALSGLLISLYLFYSPREGQFVLGALILIVVFAGPSIVAFCRRIKNCYWILGISVLVLFLSIASITNPVGGGGIVFPSLGLWIWAACGKVKPKPVTALNPANGGLIPGKETFQK